MQNFISLAFIIAHSVQERITLEPNMGCPLGYFFIVANEVNLQVEK
jgi:hypothetical protein